MSLFIAVRVDPERCLAGQPCTACITACPVNIFEPRHGPTGIVDENEDECILCDLCLERCPTDAIAIRKLYSDEIRTAGCLSGKG